MFMRFGTAGRLQSPGSPAWPPLDLNLNLRFLTSGTLAAVPASRLGRFEITSKHLLLKSFDLFGTAGRLKTSPPGGEICGHQGAKLQQVPGSDDQFLS